MTTISYSQAFVTETDSEETIKKKIAYRIKTLPDHIVILSAVGETDEIQYDIIDRFAKESQYNNPVAYITFFENTYKIWPALSPLENFKVWLLARGEDFYEAYSFEIIAILQSTEIMVDNFGSYIKTIIPELLADGFDKIGQSYNESRDKFIKAYKKDIELTKVFYKLKGIKSTDFILDRSNFEIRLANPNGYGILDLFDMMNTSEFVPFISVNGFYKIYKDIIPPDEWLSSKMGTLSLKLLGTKHYNVKKIIEIYTDTEIVCLDEEIVITIATLTNKGISQEESIDRIRSIFNFDVKDIIGRQNVSIAGVFFYANFTINMDIFSDLVMNNYVFSRYLRIDENVKLQKKKSQTYIYFIDPANPGKNNRNMVTANITNQIVERREPQLSIFDQSLFPIGSEYLRIRITKTSDINALTIFKTALDKLFELYEKERAQILAFYKSYGVELIKESTKVTKVTGKQYLKHIDPELFGPESNYTRQCLAKREPRIVSEQEAETLKKDGYDVMKFPKDGGWGVQRYYVCDKNKEFPWPGVKENKITKHAEKYPTLPCCFSKDQRGTDKYRGYFEGKEKDQTVIAGRTILGTKFLSVDQTGALPENIKILLEGWDDNYNYFRKGMNRGFNSFIECVCTALDAEFMDYFGAGATYTIEELNGYIIGKRLEIANKSVMEVVRQENYELSVDQIYKNMVDIESYFDPTRYLKLVEDYYKCNIFIFTRKDMEGNFVIPRHTMNYLRWNYRYGRSIMIFEHMGSEEADAAEYPQCELMIMEDIDKNVKIVIESDDDVYSHLNELFDQMNKSYNLNIENVPYRFPEIMSQKPCQIESQFIDEYGKTRILNVNYKKVKISLLADPLPNIGVPEVSLENSIHKISLKHAREFIQYVGATVIKKVCMDVVCMELHIMIENLFFVIGISQVVGDSEIAKSICQNVDIQPTTSMFDIIINSDSELDKFKKLKKIAYWLKEYSFWLFSQYLYDNHIEDIQEYPQNVYDNFVREFMVIVENYNYPSISQTFSHNSSILQNGKLIISSNSPDEIIKRLVYSIRLAIIEEPKELGTLRNMLSIYNYKDRIVMNSYYEHISDFRQVPNQIIFNSIDDINKWVMTVNQKIILSTKIIPDSQQKYSMPYLLQNNILTGDRIALCMNADKLSAAYNRCAIWNQFGYNIHDVPNSIVAENFNLYSYVNSEDITKHAITDGSGTIDSNINIVGFKTDETTPEFSSILFL